jgi:mxaL protein
VIRSLARLRPRWPARANRDRWLLGGAALLLAACFLRPTLPLERRLFDHVVVLDITQSMNAQDMLSSGKPVARLDHAKQALRAALTQLPCGSRIGLAIFTEYRSYLLFAPIEVCAHLQELRSTLDHIDGRMAWTGNSEIAKGLYSGIAIAHQLPDHPSLVFVTDGQEAPPVDPLRRPVFNDKPGEVPGLIVGVGGATPVPIPKRDPEGRPLGFWRAEEVQQSDPRVRPRAGDAAAAGKPAAAGTEHLSSLREGYLRLLAGETGLGYLRLDDPAALAAALTSPALARPVPARADLRVPLALLALLLLLARHLPADGRLRRRPRLAALPAAPRP